MRLGGDGNDVFVMCSFHCGICGKVFGLDERVALKHAWESGWSLAFKHKCYNDHSS